MFLASVALAAGLSVAQPSAEEILRGLDMMSFANSLRPSRAPGLKRPADWRFTEASASGEVFRLTRRLDGRDDWVIGLRIIRSDADGVVACFSDRALNGGSYLANSAVRIVPDGEGGYRAAEEDLDEPSCPPAPGQG
ncbi:MAG: hypothetical protein H2038_11950 [Brevundimonas sp.]|uniref:hypothetical protein n=1 Tax=Brevundimonas sp. TaxID=1871086 RepID=UPI001851036F|nr:hypothetical protein [Brevundimonas sp.]MBA4805355.1 hypothetical protein [Brevundimonas sp.]